MAKQTNGVNKSEEIRKLLRAQPNMTAGEIVATLAARRINVGPPQAYSIISDMRQQRQAASKATLPAAGVHKVEANGAAVPNGTVSLAVLVKVKELAADVGGLNALRQLVEVLS